jgi:hypothetical protein
MEGQRPAPMDVDHETQIVLGEAWVAVLDGEIVGSAA